MTASVWAVPTVVVASAAPAFAASLCAPDTIYTVNWAGPASHPYRFTPGSSNLQYGPGRGEIQAIPSGLTPAQAAAATPLTVTLTNTVPGTNNRMRGGTFTYDNNQLNNMRVSAFNVSTLGQRGLTLAQEKSGENNLSNPRSNHCQELTIDFQRPVKGLKFTISDIDAADNNHSDRVQVLPAVDGLISRGSAVRGNGSVTTDGTSNTTGAFRPSGTQTVNDVNGNSGNVAVAYRDDTALSTVKIRFWNNVSDGGMQWIFLSNLTFTADSNDDC